MQNSQKPTTDTKQEILQLLLKHGELKAQTLADSLQITPQAIRRHLNELESEGLVSYTSEVAGMGRPQHIYRLTKKGRDRFPAGYDQFTLSFLDTLAESLGREQFQAVRLGSGRKKPKPIVSRSSQVIWANKFSNWQNCVKRKATSPTGMSWRGQGIIFTLSIIARSPV
jgi:Predicted transcriptional regulator